jgi:hypothetical protein
MASTVQTESARWWRDLLFAGDRTTCDARRVDQPAIDLARQQAQRQADDARPCATIRSMAKWVFPVLVGPSTAVTPRPLRIMGCEFNDGSALQGVIDRGWWRSASLPHTWRRLPTKASHP